MNPAVILYRTGNWFHRNRMRGIGWALSWLNRLLFATFLPSSASIGKSFVVGYWGLGVVIHKDCVIGDHCHIGQNVTIGRNPGKDGVPVIGNHVYVGAGAVISGNINIGDHAVIGANSVVLIDIPPRCLAVGSPASVKKELLDEELKRFQ